MSETVRTESAREWQVRRLGDIARIATGATPLRNTPEYFGGDIPWVQAHELNGDIVSRTEMTLTLEGLAASGAPVFPKGSLCIALRGAAVGALGILGIDAAIDRSVCAVYPPPELDVQFLRSFFESKKTELTSNAEKGTLAKIGIKAIRSMTILVPPWEEQLEVVAKIETALARHAESIEGKRNLQSLMKRYRREVISLALMGVSAPAEAELARAEARSFEPGMAVVERARQILHARAIKARRAELEEFVRLSVGTLLIVTPMGFLEAWLTEMILADYDRQHPDDLKRITTWFLTSVNVFAEKPAFLSQLAIWLGAANYLLRSVGIESQVLGKPRDLTIRQIPDSFGMMLRESSLRTQFEEFDLPQIRQDWLDRPAEEKWSQRLGNLPESGASAIPPLPDGWAWTTLATIADIRVGATQRRGPSRWGITRRSVPCLRAPNVQPGRLDLTEVKNAEVPETEIAELRLMPGDLLLSMAGDRDERCRGTVWNGELPECVFEKQIFRVRLLDAGLDPAFYSLCIDSLWQTYIADPGAPTSDVGFLGCSELWTLQVPVPPSAEQKRIVAEVELQLRSVYKAESGSFVAIEELDQQRHVMLQRAFAGLL